MKRLKLQHGYHDALIRAVRYVDESDIMLDVDLCSCCNSSRGRTTVCLLGVRNFRDVQKALEQVRITNARRDYIDEIYAIRRASARDYLLCLQTAGELYVDG